MFNEWFMVIRMLRFVRVSEMSLNAVEIIWN